MAKISELAQKIKELSEQLVIKVSQNKEVIKDGNTGKH